LDICAFVKAAGKVNTPSFRIATFVACNAVVQLLNVISRLLMTNPANHGVLLVKSTFV